ncbi:MAG: TetR/AcrR family transcriptional regulator [Nitrospinota bacterium]|nr:TetR/AcrR family transcriptional regulator [Nitrospinota bacterium]
MPRHKEYDREEVLDRALKVFQTKGFEGTSVQDLVKATGLNRFGMYNAFGSKEGLFLEVMDRYRNEVATRGLEILLAEPRGLKNIRAYFDEMIKNYSNGKAQGCLITNTAVETPGVCKTASRKVQKVFKQLEDAFHASLTGAQQAGEIPCNTDLRARACFLVGITQGLGVFCRAKTAREQMETFVTVALEGLSQESKKVKK